MRLQGQKVPGSWRGPRNLVPFVFLLFFSTFPLHAESALSHPGHDPFRKALAAMEQGAWDEAEEQFNEALLREPMNAEYHFELANLYGIRHDEALQAHDETGAQDKLEASMRELEQAVMTKPDFMAARFNLGVVYKNLGQYEKAREEFKEVLRQDPAQGPAKLQIGATYEEQGFYDEAETIYHDLLERYPGHPELQKSLQRLEERREQGRRSEMAERQVRQLALNTGLSALAQGAQPYTNQDSNP